MLLLKTPPAAHRVGTNVRAGEVEGARVGGQAVEAMFGWCEPRVGAQNGVGNGLRGMDVWALASLKHIFPLCSHAVRACLLCGLARLPGIGASPRRPIFTAWCHDLCLAWGHDLCLA